MYTHSVAHYREICDLLILLKSFRLEETTTGNCLEVYTNQPCVQLYQGGYLNGAYIGLDGYPIQKYGGLCLETQKHPNAINQVSVNPSVILQNKINLNQCATLML